MRKSQQVISFAKLEMGFNLKNAFGCGFVVRTDPTLVRNSVTECLLDVQSCLTGCLRAVFLSKPIFLFKIKFLTSAPHFEIPISKGYLEIILMLLIRVLKQYFCSKHVNLRECDLSQNIIKLIFLNIVKKISRIFYGENYCFV